MTSSVFSVVLCAIRGKIFWEGLKMKKPAGAGISLQLVSAKYVEP
jgi:hypothetical protein